MVHARIVTADGLAADNDRWAWAPTNASVRVIVVSRDRAARDDLARILLAVNPGYRVTAIDGSPAAIHQQAQQQFDLAVLHDFAGEMIAAPNRLYVFPPTDASPSIPLHVIRSVAAAELQSLTGAPPLATPVLLGATRVIALPEWIKPLAQGSDGANNLAALPLAAAGRTPEGWVGMIAFDVRDHALLDPDRQEALLLMIDTLRIIGAPSDRKIVMTGEAVPVATFGPATLLGPDGTSSRLIADKSGQVHFRPLQPGRYALTKDRRTVEIYANYYDEAESDLTNVAVPATRAAAPDEAQPATASDLRAVPQMPLLMAIVILALLLESALMVRRSQPWGSRDV